MGIRSVAIKYIKGMTDAQKERLKQMLSNGIICGAGFARENGVEPSALTNELKLIFKGD